MDRTAGFSGPCRSMFRCASTGTTSKRADLLRMGVRVERKIGARKAEESAQCRTTLGGPAK